MILERFPEVQRLSCSEKLLLISELWNEIEDVRLAEPVFPRDY
jgi:hypothetical protein